MTSPIDALIEELRYADAAAMASAEGESERAAVLYGIAGDRARLATALDAVDERAKRRVASELERRGLHALAADAWEAGLDLERAELCFVRGRDLVGAARVAVRRGDERAAATHLEQRLADSPDDADTRLTLASLALARGRTREAAALAALVPAGDPSFAKADAVLRAAVGGETARDVGAPHEGRFVDLVAVATSPHARVLSARCRVTGEHVALKVLRVDRRDSALVRKMEVEARTLASLRHPSVVPLIAFDADSGILATRWMAGGSLRELLASGPLSAARVAEIGVALADALAAAHAASIVHRDVTPGNVLFDAAGAPNLADFGAAHVIDASVTVTAGLVGTLAYLAPEVRRGEPATPGSDVFSLGRVLSEALKGDLGDPRPPSALGVGLDARHDAVFASMLADDWRARPSAAAVKRNLQGLTWPAVAIAVPARGEPTPMTNTAELLSSSDTRVTAAPATLRAAKIASEGAAAGLSALPTIRRLTDDAIVVERIALHVERALTPDEARDVALAAAYLAERGEAHVTVISDQRGPVVVPMALMRR